MSGITNFNNLKPNQLNNLRNGSRKKKRMGYSRSNYQNYLTQLSSGQAKNPKPGSGWQGEDTIPINPQAAHAASRRSSGYYSDYY